MNILELEKFKIEDAINFHDEYNPWLFDGDKLKPAIKRQLETIADDFVEYMGIPDLAIEDIIITGSNVAYTYTSHSDIDLHLLVDFAKLPESDIYKELFNAKKSLYNDTYEITIRDIPVEVYVQDTAQSHTSLGEYSLYKDMFTRIPTKKRANLDEISAASKFERLEQLAIEGLKSDDIEKVNGVLSIIKRYRQSGLDTKGEFGPENLAFKAVRSKGYFQALFDRRNKLRAEQLSLEEEMLRRTFEESIGIYEQEVELSEEGVSEELGEYGTGMLARRYKVDRKEISKQIDLGVRLEMRHNSKVSAITPQLRRDQATEIVRNNIAKRLDYYQHYDKHMNESLRYDLDTDYDEYGMPDYSKYLSAIDNVVRKERTRSKSDIIRYLVNQFPNVDKRDAMSLISRWEMQQKSRSGSDPLVSEASGYIPSEAQKNDPRFSYALTKDVRPDTMKKGAKAMGLGDISRAGIPPLLRPGKSSTKKKSNPNKDFGKGIY
tara:strand:- start:1636 stop:3108 length:1473 start_codon:yes stop_codon:yes gene_type:complete